MAKKREKPEHVRHSERGEPVTMLEAIREALSDESAGESEDAPAVESTRKGLRIGGVRPEGIGDALDALETAEIDFESLAWSEPSLEDVYLRLTGEEYSPRSEPLDEVAPDGGDR